MNTKLLLLALLLPLQSFAGNDSVYEWGQWSQGIQPAAGGIQSVTPPPAYKPDVSFRPNENSAFLRTLNAPTPGSRLGGNASLTAEEATRRANLLANTNTRNTPANATTNGPNGGF
ncbi:MAG: hypothetical protein OEY89_02825 [Gammaproteobacteria bacterium]|nr:hypothetical protein [Gammaproteobacteria bacterium]